MDKKEKLIKAEKERLIGIFEDIEQNKLDFVKTLIDRLAWLNVNIKEVEKKLDEEGAVVAYNNGGGQSGVRESPYSKVRMQYTKDITTITKQLIDLVPAQTKKSKLEMLMDE